MIGFRPGQRPQLKSVRVEIDNYFTLQAGERGIVAESCSQVMVFMMTDHASMVCRMEVSASFRFVQTDADGANDAGKALWGIQKALLYLLAQSSNQLCICEFYLYSILILIRSSIKTSRLTVPVLAAVSGRSSCLRKSRTCSSSA